MHFSHTCVTLQAERQRQEQQLNLLQGALVQLNGEVNALKLKVPQLTANIKDANQGLDASQVCDHGRPGMTIGSWM
jgi:hypothetical protein